MQNCHMHSGFYLRAHSLISQATFNCEIRGHFVLFILNHECLFPFCLRTVSLAVILYFLQHINCNECVSEIGISVDWLMKNMTRNKNKHPLRVKTIKEEEVIPKDLENRGSHWIEG